LGRAVLSHLCDAFFLAIIAHFWSMGLDMYVVSLFAVAPSAAFMRYICSA